MMTFPERRARVAAGLDYTVGTGVDPALLSFLLIHALGCFSSSDLC